MFYIFVYIKIKYKVNQIKYIDNLIICNYFNEKYTNVNI